VRRRFIEVGVGLDDMPELSLHIQVTVLQEHPGVFHARLEPVGRGGKDKLDGGRGGSLSYVPEVPGRHCGIGNLRGKFSHLTRPGNAVLLVTGKLIDGFAAVVPGHTAPPCRILPRGRFSELQIGSPVGVPLHLFVKYLCGPKWEGLHLTLAEGLWNDLPLDCRKYLESETLLRNFEQLRKKQTKKAGSIHDCGTFLEFKQEVETGKFHGWFRALELTWNREEETHHPRLHVIIPAGRKSYFKKHYLETKDRVHIRRVSLNSDYGPVCGIRKIPNSGRKKDISGAAKYTFKDSEFAAENDALTGRLVGVYDKALRNRRLYASGGVMKQIARVVTTASGLSHFPLIHYPLSAFPLPIRPDCAARGVEGEAVGVDVLRSCKGDGGDFPGVKGEARGGEVRRVHGVEEVAGVILDVPVEVGVREGREEPEHPRVGDAGEPRRFPACFLAEFAAQSFKGAFAGIHEAAGEVEFAPRGFPRSGEEHDAGGACSAGVDDAACGAGGVVIVMETAVRAMEQAAFLEGDVP
jgi:hypothetical protein